MGTESFAWRDDGGVADVAELGLQVWLDLARAAPEGIALLDQQTLRICWLNEEAGRLLGTPAAVLLGRQAEVFEVLRGQDTATVRHGLDELECLASTVPSDQGTLRVVRFRDVTAARRRERELRAFSNTSASIAFAGSLTRVLDRLAEEVKHASGMYACTFLFTDGNTVVKQAGKSGTYPGVEDYAQRLNACAKLGAPLVALEAALQRKPLIVEGWRERTLDDPRFAPIHDINLHAPWSSIAVVPLVVRDSIMGVLNGFYLPGHEPHADDLPFLAAIADQAAVAVDNARLVAASEAKAALEERHRLARELHDSVSQALFSLTLQARAVELIALGESPDLTAIAGGLSDIRALTAGALAEMRALIFQLRPAALHEEGLMSALAKHAAAVSASHELEIRVIGPDQDLGLEEHVEEQLFRTLQEALHNIVKHAEATFATVELSIGGEDRRDLLINVCDDGAGFDTEMERPGHLGMESMAERVGGLGGSFEVRSAPGRTVVRATVPGIVGAVEK